MVSGTAIVKANIKKRNLSELEVSGEAIGALLSGGLLFWQSRQRRGEEMIVVATMRAQTKMKGSLRR